MTKNADNTTTERDEAVRAVESEFLSMAGRIRQLLMRRAELLSPGLLPGNYKVFREIAQHGPITATSLAEDMVLDKGQVSRIVAELEKRELIVRTPDPEDGRAQLLEATADARERFEEIRRSFAEHSLHSNLDAWDVADIRRLAEMLRALNDTSTAALIDQ